MTVDVFIPLKGESQRVPGKNLRDFDGSPLFHTVVNTLARSSRIGHIFINTDSEIIAESAASLGDLTVEWRKDHLRGHDVSMNLLIEDFLVDHPEVPHLAQTHSTNPLLSTATIDAAVDAYFADEVATSLFTVTRIQARVYDSDMGPINHDPSRLLQTQDLDPVYLENSCLYIFSREAFLETTNRITAASQMWEMDPFEAVDIDEEREFRLAEALHRAARLLG